MAFFNDREPKMAGNPWAARDPAAAATLAGGGSVIGSPLGCGGDSKCG